MEYDEKGRVKNIKSGLRDRLAGMGIRTGKKIRMITRQPIKGPVVVEVDGASTSLGLGLAKSIIVEIDR
ncbi:MAG: FeoA family protein [Methanotrichaceae archaeon]